MIEGSFVKVVQSPTRTVWVRIDGIEDVALEVNDTPADADRQPGASVIIRARSAYYTVQFKRIDDAEDFVAALLDRLGGAVDPRSTEAKP